MLEDSEWSVLQTAHSLLHDDHLAPMRQLAADAKRLRLRPPRPVDTSAPLMAQRLWHLIAGFEMFTRILESSPNPIYHHRLSVYGPPCSGCGKLLRTPNATYCVGCGAPA